MVSKKKSNQKNTSKRTSRSNVVKSNKVDLETTTTTTTSSTEDDNNSSSSNSVYDSSDDKQQVTTNDSSSSSDDNDDDDDYYDSEAGGIESDSSSDNNSNSEEEFEDQGSSDDDDDILRNQIKTARAEDETNDSDDELEVIDTFESIPRNWKASSSSNSRSSSKRTKDGKRITTTNTMIDDITTTNTNPIDDPKIAALIHTDDLSSDDEDPNGTRNRIGRIPLHWYDEYDHIGYDPHGSKIIKQSSLNGKGPTDRLDRALQNQEDLEKGRFVVHDALNDQDVTLTDRQIQLIRRIQAGAFAHPEHDANPDYIPYYSGVDIQVSGINSNRQEPKARFQPSKYEKRAVRQLLHRLEKGDISMEYLKGEVRDMSDVKRKDKIKGADGNAFALWRGDEEDELHNRKGPQHIAAPKVPPPTHALSYNPPEEYLPTPEEEKEWEELDVHDRPHGLLVPKKFPNLRSVGAYPHAVRERFERCLDLYLCPRIMKRRLNIDPESLIPRMPNANDLRPFPTSRCIRYETPYEGDVKPMVRCLTVSPDGQFMASGADDGYVRLWEVQTSRLLVSWNVSKLAKGVESIPSSSDDGAAESTTTTTEVVVKPIVSLEWNPNPHHHCLLASAGKTAVIIATGTGGPDDAELTDALLSEASAGRNNVTNGRASKAVQWVAIPQHGPTTTGDANDTTTTVVPISAYGGSYGPITKLHTTSEISSAKWHKKGDYFVTVSPKAGAASVLIHQLNKANSQQPFKKTKGSGREVQSACFHPSKPFLFVCGKQDIRIYHLVKQAMVKRLISGCRWISSIDVHVSGDHVIAGSLDRRMVWFDLDLSSTPYKTLKYHEKALRHVGFHPRYPLMASSSDDGCVHVFHTMVYSDLMRNPLIVPVKILRGHNVVKKLGVLSFAWHPTQPWLFSAGADGKIQLFQDI